MPNNLPVPQPEIFNDQGFGQAFRGTGQSPSFGFSNTYQPNPQAKALGKVIDILNDPRNAWMGLGKVGQAMTGLPAVAMPWLYHGTAASRAERILKEGFDAGRIGEWWGHAFGKAAGQRGPGTYFSENPAFARSWGEIAAGALGEKPAVVRAFVPQNRLLDVSNTAHTPDQAARIGEWVRTQGKYDALKFGNQIVVPDPTSIPLRNIRPFPGPTSEDQAFKQLFDALDSYDPK